MTGRWRGTRSELGWSVTADMTLTEDPGGSIAGTGHLDIVPLGGADGTVTGRHQHPEVLLVAEAPGFLSADFDGTFKGDDLVDGTVQSPFVGTISFTLHRAS